MNKVLGSIFFFSFLLVSTSLYSLEFSCEFEEVHSNGTVNQGIVLLKKDKLRYEYNNEELFIIFVQDEKTFLVDKKNQTVKNINKNLDAIEIIMDLADQYPNINENFEKNGVKIKIEIGEANNFIKRISIDSKRARLSLFLKNCILDKPINNVFFNFNPVFEYR